jgi:cobaltochelatase CobT
LIRSYQNIFNTRTLKRWVTTQTEGLIDRRYLTRIATAPLDPVLYRQPSQKIEALGKVTLLIDCSGSMKEQRLKIAICVDSLVRILEQANIQTEVLGYSTKTWQGGRPFKEWRRSGQAPNPGRLNERAHWIFKDFQTHWRKARPGIAALLRPEIYAESIDGEAVLWAAQRLQMEGGHRDLHKKLILFSDGCPMDRATIEANGEYFLKNHLLQTIEWCKQQNHFELWGCGIGDELRPFFPNRLSWDQEEGLTECLINWCKELKSAKI